MIASGRDWLCRAVKLVLGTAGLVFGVAATAGGPTPQSSFETVLRAAQARAAHASARREDFGWLADLAGSCWTTDARPTAAVCFWFGPGGRSLHSRQLIGLRIEAESQITPTGWPGVLLETTRVAGLAGVLRHQLQFAASSGLIHRTVQHERHEDPGDPMHPFTRWTAESFRRIDRDRFEFVQSSGRGSGGYGPHPARDRHTQAWTFVRSAPWIAVHGGAMAAPRVSGG